MRIGVAKWVLAVGVVATMFGLIGSLQGCATNRREVRQEERVEQRTQDRYERRRGE